MRLRFAFNYIFKYTFFFPTNQEVIKFRFKPSGGTISLRHCHMHYRRFSPNSIESFVFKSVSIYFKLQFSKYCLQCSLYPKLPSTSTPLKLSCGIIKSYFNKKVLSPRFFCFINLICGSIHQNTYRLNVKLQIASTYQLDSAQW